MYDLYTSDSEVLDGFRARSIRRLTFNIISSLTSSAFAVTMNLSLHRPCYELGLSIWNLSDYLHDALLSKFLHLKLSLDGFWLSYYEVKNRNHQ